MKRGKVWVLLLGCMFGSTLVSCFTGSCDYVQPYFEIKSVSSETYRFNDSELNPWEAMTDGQSVRWDLFFIRFQFEVGYVAQAKMDFGPTLWATTCADPGGRGSKVGIDTLFITTLEDYNESFKAGDTLNSIVTMNSSNYFRDDFYEFYPLTTYIQLNKEGVRQPHFDMKFSEPPSETAEHSFELIYLLKNGEEFRHTTQPVLLW